MTNNKNNNSVKISTYRSSYIVTGVLFIIVLAICLFIFGVIALNADKDLQVNNSNAGFALDITRIIAFIVALICALLLCVRCATVNKIKNPDMFIPPRDTFYYIKRIGFFAIMIVLMNISALIVGMLLAGVASAITFGINNGNLREFLTKLPIFIVYLAFVYKMLVRFGFMDSQRKIFNPNFKMLTFIIAFILLLPSTVNAHILNSVNVQMIFSYNLGMYIIDGGFTTLNENFSASNIILIAAITLATFAIQAAVFMFAYNRGKKIFIKQHIRAVDEYDTDENI